MDAVASSRQKKNIPRSSSRSTGRLRLITTNKKLCFPGNTQFSKSKAR